MPWLKDDSIKGLSFFFGTYHDQKFNYKGAKAQRNAEKIMTTEEINDLSFRVIACAIEVHRNMGPGLLESVYEHCLMDELQSQGIEAKRQVHVPLIYKGKELEASYAIDLLVEDEIVIELKAVTEVHPVFEAQVISYLKLADKRLGFLLNFHVPIMKSGIRRFANGL